MAPMAGEAPYIPKPGDVLDDRWRLIERIGQGAMGSVFSGTDLTRNARVAVKILSAEHSKKSKVLARFEREARLMTTLRHPNIIQLLSFGWRGAIPFLVMSFLEGRTLADRLRDTGGKLSPVETLEVVRQVCAGLSFIHHHGLVHRDIKPQNIFLSPEGHATILDLGVARDKSNPGLTKPGAMVGTPYYMAPEQILGTSEVDKRADVYALGAVIFELLTGTPPFVADNNFEVLYAHKTLPPPDASLLSGFVPKPVARAITRAMAKAPDGRQQSVHELLAELEAGFSLGAERTHPGLSLPVLEALKGEKKRKRPATVPPRAPVAEDEPPMLSSSEIELVPSLDVDPTAETGELRVITTVKGLTSSAAVLIDGAAQGNTPAFLTLPVGPHRLRVERAGFRPEERDVQVRVKEVTLVRLALEPSAH